MKRHYVVLSALATVMALGLTSAPAHAADRYINVTATGTVKVVPDTVRINATVSVIGASNKAASTAANETASALRKALAANGIDTKYIKSQSLTIYPEYNYTQDKGSVLTGYRASQQFEIIVRNAANAGTVVDAIVAASGDNLQLNGVTPYVYDDAQSTSAARAAAITRAKAKATTYAKLLGVKLSSVTFLEETSAPSPYPIMMATAKMDSGATIVDLGQQDVSVSVNVRWSIK